MSLAGRRWRAVLVAAVAAMAVAALGAAATDLGPWYQSLVKPSWQPPDWLFGPAWTLIYALAALLGRAGLGGRPRHSAAARGSLALFALNALLNVAWSELFFGLQRPDWALAEVGAAVAVDPAADRRAAADTRGPPAGCWCPYLAWVTFAACLEPRHRPAESLNSSARAMVAPGG